MCLDDLDFLTQLPNEVEENSLLVSFDVVSLYTSIPHDLGLQAIRYWLVNHDADIAWPLTTDLVLKAIEVILKENTFKFNDKNYKQIQGTAMGTKMDYLEKQLYARFLDIYITSETEKFISTFKRFLDDCKHTLLFGKAPVHEPYKFTHSRTKKRKITDAVNKKADFTFTFRR